MSALQSAMIYEEEHSEISEDAPQDNKDNVELLIKELEALELPSEDGIPMESNWHRHQMNLLIEFVDYHWRDRNDYFAGGNMFIYFSMNQVKNKDYRGPDVFVVKNTISAKNRESWVVWNEDGKYPDVIIELSSPSTINIDLKYKKRLYEQTFHTTEYFCYDPATQKLMGWRLSNGRYQDILPNDKGWLLSKELNLWIGKWEGELHRINTLWLRLFTDNNELVPTFAEAEAKKADDETKRADGEAKRAKEAEDEINRLKALLLNHNIEH